MLSLLLILSHAAARPLDEHVLGTLALLTLAHRMEQPGAIRPGDPDREYARQLFEAVGYPGVVSRVERRQADIETPPYTPTAKLLGVAYANDGYPGEWSAIAARLARELTEVPRKDGVAADAIARELGRHVMTPSHAVARLRTPTQARVQLDLLAALGRTGDPAAVTTLQKVACGTARTWETPWIRPEFAVVMEALREIEPRQVVPLMAIAIDATHAKRLRILREVERRAGCADPLVRSNGLVRRAWDRLRPGKSSST